MRSTKKRHAQGQSVSASSRDIVFKARFDQGGRSNRAGAMCASLAGRAAGRARTAQRAPVVQPNLIPAATSTGVIAHPAVANGVWDGGGDGISLFGPLNWSNDVLPRPMTT